MNRDLETIKNWNESIDKKAKAIMGHFGEDVGKKVLEIILKSDFLKTVNDTDSH